MITFSHYEKPSTPEKAYELYQENGSVLAAGMMWIRLSSASYNTYIDLAGTGLDFTEETASCFRFGAMTPLRQIETDRNFRDYTCGASTDALKHIVGVQFRNLATIGGSICGKFGFSDVSTLFLALDSTVELLKGGTVPLSEYLAARNDKDILLSVSVRKEDLRAVYNSVRNTATDFPILSMCMARPEGSPYRVSIGARPSRAQLAVFDLPADSSEDLSDTVLSGYTFGSNRRGSAEYREHLARVLLNRSLAAVRQ